MAKEPQQRTPFSQEQKYHGHLAWSIVSTVVFMFFQINFPHPLPGGHLTFLMDSPRGAG